MATLFSKQDHQDVLELAAAPIWLSMKAIGRPDGFLGTSYDSRRKNPFIVQWYIESLQPFMPRTTDNTLTRHTEPMFYESERAYYRSIKFMPPVR